MRPTPNAKVERYRVTDGPTRSTVAYGNNGHFFIPCPDARSETKLRQLFVVASDGMGWEHVSVSLAGRCPTWPEMCYVKELFWGDDECVIEYHPRRAVYVTCHPFCLHLWKPIGIDLPEPFPEMVGPLDAKEKGS